MGGLCRSRVRPLASFCLLAVFVSAAFCLQEIAYQGLVAKQSTDRFGLTLREVWDGSRLTQALSSSGEVLACEVSRLPLPPPAAPTGRNHSLQSSSGSDLQPPPANLTADLPPDFSWLPTLREDCRRAQAVHTRAKRSSPKRRTRHGKHKMKKMRKGRRKDHLAKGKTGRWTENLITPGTKWCGPSNMAARYAELGPSWEADRCCRTHDQCQEFILGMSKGFATVNFNPFTVSHCSCDRRKGEEPLRVPGTMWCGRGYSATSYKQLGAFAAADRCCRRHDTACPHWIPALSHRYGLYNWRPSTLMHCHCDRRFRTCLKMAGTTASNFVGKLFFNLVQTKCFVLKTERICTQRNWWGKCQRTELKRLAHIRSNMAF